ncbi:MAG: BON domain-containing protein [Gemmatimonadaceae bacterium]
MSPFRYRDEDHSLGSTLSGVAIGALAGFAVGVVIAQKVGGLSGLTSRIRERFGDRFGHAAELEAGDAEDAEATDASDEDDLDDDLDDELEEDELGDDELGDDDDEELDPEVSALEDRVLEAFRNDPILAERGVDIGAVGDGIIELSGVVNDDEEAQHAVTIAGGVPGVDTVVNRLAVGEEDETLEATARRFAAGDPALTEARWEGQRVGTGRRRQGTSAEFDRHATPKAELEDRWMDEAHALRDAAEDTAGLAGRGRRKKKAEVRGDRTGGAPIAPTGVPKADHVVNPESAADSSQTE